MNMKYLLTLIFTFIASLGLCEITTIKSFQEADLSKLTPNSLVIFDVDEVLIAPADAILTPAGDTYTSPFWPNLLRNRELFSIVLNTTDYVLIDPATLKFIEELHQRNIPVIALTACGTGSVGQISSLVSWRIQQLEKLGVKFNFFYKKPHVFRQLVNARENAPVYENGILFCGDFARQKHSKGRLLWNFFDLIDWEPDHVILFDDQFHNHSGMEIELAIRGIPYHGYHFLADFNALIEPEIVELQLATLYKDKIWLSDEQARLLLKENSEFGIRNSEKK